MADDQNDKKDELAPSTSSKVEKKRFELLKFSGVVMWSSDFSVDNCAICRNLVKEVCLNCQANSKSSDDVCSVAWGVCNHKFHLHCISRWLKTLKVCPLDNKDWKFQKIGK